MKREVRELGCRITRLQWSRWGRRAHEQPTQRRPRGFAKWVSNARALLLHPDRHAPSMPPPSLPLSDQIALNFPVQIAGAAGYLGGFFFGSHIYSHNVGSGRGAATDFHSKGAFFLKAWFFKNGFKRFQVSFFL